MDEIVASFKELYGDGIKLAEGEVSLWIILAAVVVVLIVVGKLLNQFIFNSEAGVWKVGTGVLAPFIAGLGTFGLIDGFVGWKGVEVAGVTLHAGHIAGIVIGVMAVIFITKKLLGVAQAAAFILMVLVSLAAVGGFLVTKASIGAFSDASESIEKEIG